mgnify:CR=1 FL=1
MNNSIKSKINTAGTIGYVISILLMIAVIATMVVSVGATIATVVLPMDEVSATVSTDISLDATDHFFGKFKGVLDKATDIDTQSLTPEKANGIAINDEDIDELSIKETENGVSIQAKTGKKVFTGNKLVGSMISAVLYLAAITAMLYMLKALMKALKTCDTPFAENVVKGIERFGWSLIPVIVLSMFTEAMWQRVISGVFELSLNLEGILVLAVVFILAMVFRYGAELQKESDETL